ncbi:NrdH-redoxin [Mycobacterium eburneum]|nr:glutaredoxin domain-containing protein [Mycobacterium eburneum]TDH45423.1 NrdH-redoxin [Mycobacterium eburneum]
MSAVVYGRPGCVQCRYTTKELDRLAVPYIYVDISTDTEAAEAVAATGHTTLPVVVTEGETWAGFKPDKLRGLAAA